MTFIESVTIRCMMHSYIIIHMCLHSSVNVMHYNLRITLMDFIERVLINNMLWMHLEGVMHMAFIKQLNM